MARKMGKMARNSIFEPFSAHFFHLPGHFLIFQAIFPPFSGEAKIYFSAQNGSAPGPRDSNPKQLLETPEQGVLARGPSWHLRYTKGHSKDRHQQLCPAVVMDDRESKSVLGLSLDFGWAHFMCTIFTA